MDKIIIITSVIGGLSSISMLIYSIALLIKTYVIKGRETRLHFFSKIFGTDYHSIIDYSTSEKVLADFEFDSELCEKNMNLSQNDKKVTELNHDGKIIMNLSQNGKKVIIIIRNGKVIIKKDKDKDLIAKAIKQHIKPSKKRYKLRKP